MLSVRETVNSLYGAYRLARFDAGGLAFFDASIGGFWRSFSAALIVAPPYALLLTMRFHEGLGEVGALRFACVEAIAYVIAWVAFPLLMVWLTRLFGRQGHYLRYIVAYNWAGVLQYGLYLPLDMLAVGGVIARGPSDALAVIVFGLILVYTWFIARAALDLNAAAAAGIVTLDLVLSLFISAVTKNML